MIRKQFRPNLAVSVVANVARLRSHIVHILGEPYRPMSRRARLRGARRLDQLVRLGKRWR